jgi:RNA polymerase sigma factor (TIGR02999 family)
MGERADPDITALLAGWRQGNEQAAAELVGLVHGELRRLAAAYLRRERSGHTLQPTALVNEAYLRLAGVRQLPWENRAHFFGMAARVMKQVLVDHARRRGAAKRAGGQGSRLSLSGVADKDGFLGPVEVMALHEALDELAQLDPRQATITIQRYFGGLSVDELAAVQGLSPATIKRELLTARLWLRRRLRTGP